jgi:hypothetical protein
MQKSPAWKVHRCFRRFAARNAGDETTTAAVNNCGSIAASVRQPRNEATSVL